MRPNSSTILFVAGPAPKVPVLSSAGRAVEGARQASARLALALLLLDILMLSDTTNFIRFGVCFLVLNKTIFCL